MLLNIIQHRCKGILNVDLFENNKIKVKWYDYPNFPKYNQLWDGFSHEVSILDMFLIWEIKQKITLMENNRLINPVFLVCSERSGSTIRSIFDTHKNFCAPMPLHLMQYILKYNSYYNKIKNLDKPMIINHFIKIIDNGVGKIIIKLNVKILKTIFRTMILWKYLITYTQVFVINNYFIKKIMFMTLFDHYKKISQC